MDVRRRYGGLHKAGQIDVSGRRYGGFWIRNSDPLFCCKPFHSHLTELPLNGDKILLIFLLSARSHCFHVVESLFIQTSLNLMCMKPFLLPISLSLLSKQFIQHIAFTFIVDFFLLLLIHTSLSLLWMKLFLPAHGYLHFCHFHRQRILPTFHSGDDFSTHIGHLPIRHLNTSTHGGVNDLNLLVSARWIKGS